MNTENSRELAIRLVGKLREGRITEDELLIRLSDFTFEPYWTEIASMLNTDELQRFRDYLRVEGLPETISINLFGGMQPSQAQKVRIRKWLDETEEPGTIGGRESGIAIRYVYYFRENSVPEYTLFYVLSEYVFDEDWSVISKLLSTDQIRAFREYLQRKSSPESQEVVDPDVVLCSPEKKERIRQWLQETAPR